MATFLRCAKQWEYAYIYRIKSPPTLKQIIGIAAHEAVELNFTQKVQTYVDLPIRDVTDAFSDSYDRMLPEVEDIEIDEKAETPAEGKDSGVKLLKAYQERVAVDIQPVLVEQDVQFKVNGTPYSGTIDLVDDARRIRDLKTTKRKPSGGDYALAMTGYALGYRHATGETESGVILDYMVRTRDPYYWPVSTDDPVPDKAVNSFVRIVDQITKTIQSGVFLPTGLKSYACSWCGYREMCDAYQAL